MEKSLKRLKLCFDSIPPFCLSLLLLGFPDAIRLQGVGNICVYGVTAESQQLHMLKAQLHDASHNLLSLEGMEGVTGIDCHN